MITMAEIARLTKVSQPTVSRVLNGNQSVNPEIRERVLACAREHDYQPNALAIGMKGRKTKLLGVLMTDISNGFFADLAKQIEQEARRFGYSIILFNSDYNLRHEQDYLDVVRRYKVDGVLAVPIRENSDSWKNGVKKLAVPIVIITRHAQEMDSVYVDHEAAGALVAQHLAAQGYENFLFIGRSYDMKYLGFQNKLMELGYQLGQTVTNIDYSDYRQLKQDIHLYLGTEKHTGIFAFNDMCAIQVLRALHELGIEVPGRAGVVGFDNTSMGRYLCPSLSSVTQPLERIAEKAVTRLLYKIDHPDETSILDERLETSLIIRESSN